MYICSLHYIDVHKYRYYQPCLIFWIFKVLLTYFFLPFWTFFWCQFISVKNKFSICISFMLKMNSVNGLRVTLFLFYAIYVPSSEFQAESFSSITMLSLHPLLDLFQVIISNYLNSSSFAHISSRLFSRVFVFL